MAQREQIGKCYFCGEAVLSSKGQILTYKLYRGNGQTDELPVHKKCRKLAKKQRI